MYLGLNRYLLLAVVTLAFTLALALATSVTGTRARRHISIDVMDVGIRRADPLLYIGPQISQKFVECLSLNEKKSRQPIISVPWTAAAAAAGWGSLGDG